MSEPVTRDRPSVDLDDFERRMHHTQGGHHDDPLAELARLVGEQRDPYDDVFAQEAVPASQHYGDHQEPVFEENASPRLAGSFAAIEAGLRGAVSPHAEHDESYDPQGHYNAEDQQLYAYQGEAVAPPRTAGSRRPMYLMAATIAVGVLGVGGAFALKGHSMSPADVKTIMAAEGPTKIQPPAQATTDQGPQDSPAITGGNQTAPTKLVSNMEEPVDVGQAVQDNARADNAKTDDQHTTDASSVPMPPMPGQADGTPQSAADPASSAAPVTDFGLGMPAPKKVKVVSVRPDGSILSDAPAAPAPAAPAIQAAAPSADDHQAPAAKAPKTSIPKSVSRVLPKHVAAAPADDAVDPPAPKPAHKAKPQKLAMAEPADAPAADDAATKSAGGGGFAVQLAAPGSEADARSASSRLAKKFASELDGRHLGFHKAQSNGKSVFRVRVSSLSKDDAVSLCEKLKSSGGTCFVAKNN